MCFKPLRSLSFLLLLTTLFLGCDLPIGEEPPPPREFKFQNESTECLAKSVGVMEDFFAGIGEPQKLAEAWDCSIKAINTFEASARGQQEGRYSPRELANFFETYLLKGKHISEELLSEAMRLKPIFIGGSSEYLTKEELQKTREFFLFLKEQSIKLLPYMKIYVFKWELGAPSDLNSRRGEEFEQGAMALHQFAKTLGEHVGANGASYDLRNLVAFIKEFEKIYEGKVEFGHLAERYLPLVAKVKSVLSGGDAYALLPHEWKDFLVLGLRSFSQYQRYHYFMSDDSQGKSGDVTFVLKTMDDVSAILHSIVATKPSQKITERELNSVVSTIEEYWPNVRISKKLIQESLILKQAIFGGDHESIKLVDFENIRSKLDSIGSLAKDLYPILPYITLDRRDELFRTEKARKLQNQSEEVLLRTADRISHIIEGSYHLDNLLSLIDEIEKSLPGPDTVLLSVQPYLSLLQEFKLAFIGAPANEIQVNQWQPFFKAMAMGASHFLEYSYFLGKEASRKELEDFFLQVSEVGAIQLADLLDNKKSKELSEKELHRVLKELSVHLPNSRFSEDFTKELLSFKQFFIGGSAQGIRSTELKQVSSYLKRYKASLGDLVTHFDYFAMTWTADGQSPVEQQKKRSEARHALSQIVGLLSVDFKRDHSIGQLLDLAEKANLYFGKVFDIDFGKIRKELPLFYLTKSQLLGGKPDAIEAKRWPILLDWGQEAYLSFLDYFYFMKAKPFDQGEGLTYLNGIVETSTDLFQSILAQQYNNYLPLKKLDPILEKLESKGWLPENMGAEFVSDLIDYLFTRITPGGAADSAIYPQDISYLKSQFQDWYGVQKDLEELFKDHHWTTAEVLELWQQRIDDLPQASRQAHSQMFRALDSTYPLVHNSAGELWLLAQGQRPLYHLRDLFSINWKRVVLRELIRTYAREERRQKKIIGIKEAEAEELFREVKPFAIALGYLDPANLDFAASRFMEANIFTTRANGDDVYDFIEGIDQFSLIESGIQINLRHSPVVLDNCAQADDQGKPAHKIVVPLACARNVYLAHMVNVTRNMPQMGLFFEGLSPKDQLETLIDIEIAANVGRLPGNRTKVSDLELLPHIMQYLENVFIRFDKNRDHVFDVEEAIEAFPVYKELLKQFSPLKNDRDLEAIFTFMLKYGEPPTGGNIAKYAWWRFRRDKWEFQADRKRLARVMAEIRKIINESGLSLKQLKGLKPSRD